MLDAIVQGIIQGLTEFLPVSSSGHLILAQHLFGFGDLDPAFNVFVQGGTILSLLAYYFPRLRSLHLTPRYILLLGIATVPAVMAGLLLQDQIETLFGSLDGLAFGFLLTTLFLAATYWIHHKKTELTVGSSAVIGLAQAAAILPSLSRSGATIGMALILGIEPAVAFDFSFLMSIPVMVGSTLLSVRHLAWTPTLAPAYLTGFVVAAVVGYGSLFFLARVMRQGKFYIFAPYTLMLAILSFFLAR